MASLVVVLFLEHFFSCDLDGEKTSRFISLVNDSFLNLAENPWGYIKAGRKEDKEEETKNLLIMYKLLFTHEPSE